MPVINLGHCKVLQKKTHQQYSYYEIVCLEFQEIVASRLDFSFYESVAFSLALEFCLPTGETKQTITPGCGNV